MILLSHPVGNSNSRQALLTFYENHILAGFYTTVVWDDQSKWNRFLPQKVRVELNRRAYPGIPKRLIHTTPIREMCRLLSGRLGIKALAEMPDAPFSVKRICEEVDDLAARGVFSRPHSAVYAYEGAALQTFRAARDLGVKTIYELPIAYWHYMNKLFREEAHLQPAYADTFPKGFIDPDWLRCKDEELELADQIIVPSGYVRSTLPSSIRAEKISVIPYGAPTASACKAPHRPSSNRKLRVLYVGTLTQRKGISYMLEAVQKVESAVELTILGSRVGTCKPLDAALQKYPWIPTAPHNEVLETMSRHEVLVFPTLAEGLALVILEAMSYGMAVITTPNSGGTEVIRDGVDGFIVPIRSSDAIAEKLELLAGNRELLKSISDAAMKRAQECSWLRYRELLRTTVAI